MLTAKEARERIERLKEKERIEKLIKLDASATEQDMLEREQVEATILRATSSIHTFYEYHCEICFDISKNTEEYLKLNFYRVERISDPRCGDSIHIHW